MMPAELKWLIATYPKAFFFMKVKPIQLKIHKEILKENRHGIPGKKNLFAAIKYYVRSQQYLRAVAKKGAWRIDLNGYKIQPVSKEHAIIARNAVKKWTKIRNQRVAEAKAEKLKPQPLNTIFKFKTGLKPLLSLKNRTQKNT
jgi:sRNA-binding protein